MEPEESLGACLQLKITRIHFCGKKVFLVIQQYILKLFKILFSSCIPWEKYIWYTTLISMAIFKKGGHSYLKDNELTKSPLLSSPLLSSPLLSSPLLSQLERPTKQMREAEQRLKAIPQFCFPDAKDWSPVSEYTRYGCNLLIQYQIGLYKGYSSDVALHFHQVWKLETQLKSNSQNHRSRCWKILNFSP